MCHPAAAFAVTTAMAVAQKQAADAQQSAEYAMAKANTDRANEGLLENSQQAQTDINLQEIEQEKAVSSNLDANYLQQIQGLAQVNVKGDAAGFSGSSLDALYNQVNSSYAGQAQALSSNFNTAKAQAGRERKAQHTATKYGLRREKFLFKDTTAQAGLKMGQAGMKYAAAEYKGETTTGGKE